MKKQISYLLLCATLLGQSATVVSATSVANNVINEQPASQLESSATTNLSDNMSTVWGEATITYDAATKTIHVPAGSKIFKDGSRTEMIQNVVQRIGITPEDVVHIIFQGSAEAGNSMYLVFADLPNLETIDGLNNLDTSKVTDMIYMFDNSRKLTTLDVSSFDTSSVTSTRSMFSRTNITSLDLSSFDTSAVKDMSGMFSNTSLKTIDVSNFNTSNVTSMKGMFSNTSLKAIDVSNFNTSNVTSMSSMFEQARDLTSLEGLSSFDTSNVTDMSGMFRSTSLKTIDLSNFNTSNVSDMAQMFYGNRYLTSLEGLSFFDTSNVTDMSSMFGASLESLKELDLSSFDTSHANVSNMFASVAQRSVSLEKLILGKNVVSIENTRLPDEKISSTYTGKWRNVGEGSAEEPNGSNIWSSSEFMANYDGAQDADTYVFQRTIPAESVTVKYVDENNEEIREAQTISGNVDDSYDASTSEYRVDIEGYTLDESKLPSNATGELSNVAQTVTYVYTKNQVQGGNVIVRYQDESGKSISDDVVLKGNVGESYSSSKKDIKNYTIKEIKGSASGKFTDQVQTVTYVYKANATTTTPSKQEAVNVYRLYNKKSMEHLYTADAYEYKHLPEISSDWVREGINFKEYKKSDSTTVTVHRVYNPKSGEHLNTTDSNEVKVLTSKGWKSEGVAFYAPKTDGKPVYRLFNPKAGIGAHFMTADSYEKSVLTKAPKEWKYEGVAWNSVK